MQTSSYCYNLNSSENIIFHCKSFNVYLEVYLYILNAAERSLQVSFLGFQLLRYHTRALILNIATY